jgi:hypothetical protein
MRHLFTGLVAAVAVMAAAPAFACGYTPCGAPVYVAPAPVVDYGCNPCGGGGWAHERLAAPEQQYYYVNQGPTYTGPGAWAPARVYQEETASGYGVYHRPHYGYRHHAYRWHHPHMGYHHGYAPRHAYAPYHYGHRVLRRYY